MTLKKIPELWPGENAVIIGGGPSFNKVDINVMRDLSQRGKIKIISVNKAYKEIKDANAFIHAMWFGDGSFYKVFRNKKEYGLHTFAGIKASCCPSAYSDKMILSVQRDRKKRYGITDNRHKVCWNKNSGASCINFAFHLIGSKGKIFLFGFDMNNDANKSHWHDGYLELNRSRSDKVNMVKQSKLFKSWLDVYPMIKRDAKAYGLEIFNVNLNSALNAFPKIDFNEFVKMVEMKEN